MRFAIYRFKGDELDITDLKLPNSKAWGERLDITANNRSIRTL